MQQKRVDKILSLDNLVELTILVLKHDEKVILNKYSKLRLNYLKKLIYT